MRHSCRRCIDRICFHFCCWAWRLAIIAPLIHVALHFIGLPHSENLGLVP